jgi:hypothetical protein
VQGHGLLGPLGRLWQGLQRLDAGAQVADRFQVRRAVAGVLARPLPVAYRLLGAARRRVVLGHQLRLGLADLGKAGLHYLGNALMVLLAGAAQQGLIGGLLDQRVLEAVCRLRR